MILVSVDGGCDAIKDGDQAGRHRRDVPAVPGEHGQQGRRGARRRGARRATKPPGYLDTGVELITGDPVDGVESRDEAFGVRNCWGD